MISAETHPDPAALIQAQLDAYNAHDIDAFVACYAEDVRAAVWPSDATRLQGRIAFAGYYRLHRFNRPNLHAELVNRIVFGHVVIDHEIITGLDQLTVEVVAMYQIKDGLIASVHFVEYEPDIGFALEP
ncbi:nuclear transport factor 2 family protein [Amantichitinum ursilacus]|uniref:SnoaL-like domain protein n=1 Tax=Amantichitinum ursilacus TaxID=857265 RepID=A0A0N0GPV2_9NEIS|nr:nuclear transport factor 2 family protein [Amantichitinum ursilacus]KPC54072.1 SnoaL-like domain protein [Amantichitinum ursilacus]